MQLSERDKVLQVQRIKQWNGNHDTGIKHCHLLSPGWAQKSLRKSRWFSQHKDTWWKDRGFVENQEAVTKTTDLPWKSTQNYFRSLLSSGSSDPERKGEGMHGTKLWHSVELQSCLGGEQEKQQWQPRKGTGGEQNYQLWAPSVPVVPLQVPELQRQKTKNTNYVKKQRLEKEAWFFHLYLTCVLFKVSSSVWFLPFAPLLPIAFPHLICHEYTSHIIFFWCPTLMIHLEAQLIALYTQ